MFQNSNQSKFPETLSDKLKSLCRRFSFVTVMLLFWLVSFTQSSKTLPSASPETDEFLKTNQKLLGTNLVVLAYKDGKVVYKKELEKEIGDFLLIFGPDGAMNKAILISCQYLSLSPFLLSPLAPFS